MATRRNLCPNPALHNNTTGWTSNATAPARVDVTGQGFSRQFAAHYTDGSVMLSPQGAASPGLSYTVSVYAKPLSFALVVDFFIEFLDSGGNSLAFSSNPFNIADNTVGRMSRTDTAPASTAFVWGVVSGENYASNATYFTECLIEQSATLGTYFDGATAGATWDGTAGNSTSTLIEGGGSPPPRSPYAGARRRLLVR